MAWRLLAAQPLLQAVAQVAPAVEQAGLDGVLGGVLQAGDVGQRHVFQGPEHQGLALQRVAQAAQAVEHAVAALLAGQALGRRGRLVRQGLPGGLAELGLQGGAQAALAQPVHRLVARQGQQPGAEGHAAVEAVRVAPEVQEHVGGDLLSQGLGLGPAGGQLQPGEDLHLARPVVPEHLQRLLVARLQGSQLEQGFIVRSSLMGR
jgi:hypothetical protein